MNEEALRRHWDEEAVRFGLKPWQCPPVLIEAGEADENAGTAWAESLPRARELHAEIIANDPQHYVDIWQEQPKSTKRRS
jgi:hypothetical protein